MIFIYNEKFILNAAEFRNGGSSEEIYNQSENIHKFIAKKFYTDAESYRLKAELLQGQDSQEEAEELFQKAHNVYQNEAYSRIQHAKLLLNPDKMKDKSDKIAKAEKMKEAAEEYFVAGVRFYYAREYYTQRSDSLKTQNRNQEAEEILKEGNMAYEEVKKIEKDQADCRAKYAELLLALVKMNKESELPLDSDKMKKKSDKITEAEKIKAKADKIKAEAEKMNEAGNEYIDAGVGLHDLGSYYKKDAELLKTQNHHQEAEEILKEAEKIIRESTKMIEKANKILKEAKEAYENEKYCRKEATLILEQDKIKEE